MLILGLNAYHGDSAACLVEDGRLVAAVEEERFRRVKHWAGCPSRAAEYCLAARGVTMADVDRLAVNRDATAHLLRKVGFSLRSPPAPVLVADRLRNQWGTHRVGGALRRDGVATGGVPPLVRVEHHYAHMASAFLVSPFEEAVVLSVDGFGDFASAAWGVGRGGKLAVRGRVFFPHSLGIFYQALTQFLGFPHYGDEYKVMGLAPHGSPRMLDRLRRILHVAPDGRYRLDLRYFRHHRARLSYRWEGAAPSVEPLYSPALEELLGPAYRPGADVDERRRDLASSVQRRYEEALFALLRALHARLKLDGLALAGGCALNAVANGKILEETPFRRTFIQPAAGDAGGALGAGLVAGARAGGDARRFRMEHAYWGPAFDEAQCRRALERRARELPGKGTWTEAPDEERLCDVVAESLAEGRIVGWFQGRMEWGPRALGNRSILADPRRADMAGILNRRIKRRETFRPFAPAVLREALFDWFHASEEDPFMTRVVPVRPERRARVPAITHVDGTARPQAVGADTNLLLHRLIRAFAVRTTVPLLLNTSFNDTEPIVRTPEEALDCFLRTGMDVLVLGRQIVSRG